MNDASCSHFKFHFQRAYFVWVVWFLSIITAAGQSGTSSSPFTALGQAWHVPSSSIYHFSIGGTAFSTYVEAGNGWVLAISGSAFTMESIYGATNNLTFQSDKILPVAVYTSSDIVGVRINATSGPNIPFDVQSVNAGVLSNLRNNRTLSWNSNGQSWTGTGAFRMTKDPSCSFNFPLNTFIYHACNNFSGLHWMPGNGPPLERVNYNSGGPNSLNLWIRANAVALPVELLSFEGKQVAGKVQLSWETVTEINNRGFQIERSQNGTEWESLDFIPGHGTTQEPQFYTFTDERPLPGLNYYRLQQVDFDGQYEYSEVRSVYIPPGDENGFSLFPNPASGEVFLQWRRASEEEVSVRLYNSLGAPVLQEIFISPPHENSRISLKNLPAGIYLVMVEQGGKSAGTERLVIW